MQAPAQRVVPPGHMLVHMPPLQAWPAAHFAPHAPQFARVRRRRDADAAAQLAAAGADALARRARRAAPADDAAPAAVPVVSVRVDARARAGGLAREAGRQTLAE